MNDQRVVWKEKERPSYSSVQAYSIMEGHWRCLFQTQRWTEYSLVFLQGKQLADTFKYTLLFIVNEIFPPVWEPSKVFLNLKLLARYFNSQFWDGRSLADWKWEGLLSTCSLKKRWTHHLKLCSGSLPKDEFFFHCQYVLWVLHWLGQAKGTCYSSLSSGN